jgi:methionyl aminopeptidase
MAITYKTKQECDIIREGGKRLAHVIAMSLLQVKEGVSTWEINEYAEKLMFEMGDSPAFKGYTPHGVSYPYPSGLCISLNEEIVHGIPKKDIFLQNGDIITLDGGLKHNNLFTDHAITMIVGGEKHASIQVRNLLSATQMALDLGIEAAQCGNTVGDIGFAIESFVNRKYGIVRDLAGHGVGYTVHEDPFIPNYGKKGKGAILKEGMVIAIEPMLTLGTDDVDFLDDEYTVLTCDDSLSAHFEHTIIITKDGPIIATKE